MKKSHLHLMHHLPERRPSFDRVTVSLAAGSLACLMVLVSVDPRAVGRADPTAARDDAPVAVSRPLRDTPIATERSVSTTPATPRAARASAVRVPVLEPSVLPAQLGAPLNPLLQRSL